MMTDACNRSSARTISLTIVLVITWLISLLVIGVFALGPIYLPKYWGLDKASFFEFPIEDLDSFGIFQNLFFLPNPTRIIFSVVYYLLFIAMFATVPFYFNKCFENTQFYLEYKKFWCVGALVFLSLIWDAL